MDAASTAADRAAAATALSLAGPGSSIVRVEKLRTNVARNFQSALQPERRGFGETRLAKKKGDLLRKSEISRRVLQLPER